MTSSSLLLTAIFCVGMALATVTFVHIRYRLPLRALREEIERDIADTVPAPLSNAAPALRLLAEDVRRLKRDNNLLHQQSIRDPLTGLGNRRLLEQRLEIALPMSRRWMYAVSALMIDVDHFKAYNDLYGHQAGDACLIEIANVLRDTFRRDTDIVVRLGGEEFLVVTLDTDAERAMSLAEAMRAMLQAVGIPHAASQAAEVVTVSIGVATTAPGQAVNLAEMLANADAALYECKANGRNCVASRHDDAGLSPPSAKAPLA